MVEQKKSRPGGRTERVREAVFAAMAGLLEENQGDIPSLTSVAARAGVNQTTIYRRWPDARTLAAAVATERLMRDLPVPDAGILRDDLLGWAEAAAGSLSSKHDIILLNIVATTPDLSGEPRDIHELPIGRRVVELEAMLARAAARGEPVPLLSDVFEIVLAPLYLQALFFGPLQGSTGVARLVDRLLSLTQSGVS